MKRRTINWKFEEFPGMAHEARYGIVAAVIGSAIVGAGTTVYEGSQQQKASAAANTQNQQNVSTANDQSWTDYLMSRGENPGGTAPFGTIPTSSAPVNTKLPLWATVNVPNKFATSGGSPALSSALAPGGSPVGGTPTGATAQGYRPTPSTTTPGF